MSAPVRSYHDTGDGDRCPLVPEHGKMYVSKDHQTQRCVHQSHDGDPKTAVGGERPATRASWPLSDDALARAVEEYLGRSA